MKVKGKSMARAMRFYLCFFTFCLDGSPFGSGAIFGGKRGARLTPFPRSLGLPARLLVSIIACDRQYSMGS